MLLPWLGTCSELVFLYHCMIQMKVWIQVQIHTLDHFHTDQYRPRVHVGIASTFILSTSLYLDFDLGPKEIVF